MRCRWLVLLFPFLFHPSASAADRHGKPASGAEVVREINLARQHPGVYVDFLKQLRGNFRGRVLVWPGEKTRRTSEGASAVDEAIRFLRHARPVSPLIISPGMVRAAAEHVADQAAGTVGHTGSDHSTPADRISRHGTLHGCWSENISYGNSRARNIVLALIVDDGLRSRQHRRIVFNPAFRYAGAALGSHARYRTACTVDFAAGYIEGRASSRSLVARN
jgi:uncharacterized protein YkwD